MKDCTVKCNCPTNTNSLIRVNVLYITVIDQSGRPCVTFKEECTTPAQAAGP